MISYEVYKVIHILSLVVVAACMGVGFFVNPPKKWARILGMTASFLLLVGGMGLLARAYPGEPWPTWVKAKIGIWMVVAIATPILTRKLKDKHGAAFTAMIGLLMLAIILAIYQPWT